MSYLRDRAFVLKKEPFREHDRRYTLYGRDHGLLSAVARGTSLRTSKQAGHLEPFSDADVMIAHGKTFEKLAVARGVGRRDAASRLTSIGALAVMGAFCDLVLSLIRPGIADSRIHDLLHEVHAACTRLPQDASALRLRMVFAGAAFKLLDLLGYGPPLEPNRMSPQGLTLLKFLRHFPLTEALRVTAHADVLLDCSVFVEDALRHTPLEHPPHGPATIAALAGSM